MKFIFLDPQGERAISPKDKHVEFRKKEKAFSAAREYADEHPGEEIEIYQLLATAVVPTAPAVIKSVEREVGKSPLLAAPYGKKRWPP